MEQYRSWAEERLLGQPNVPGYTLGATEAMRAYSTLKGTELRMHNLYSRRKGDSFKLVLPHAKSPTSM